MNAIISKVIRELSIHRNHFLLRHPKLASWKIPSTLICLFFPRLLLDLQTLPPILWHDAQIFYGHSYTMLLPPHLVGHLVQEHTLMLAKIVELSLSLMQETTNLLEYQGISLQFEKKC
jgi:hypothetical protein